MPKYAYECPVCGLALEYQRPIAKRDNVKCAKCSAFMKRTPAAPNFAIMGFNAANGYTTIKR